MSGRLTRGAFAKLIDEDVEWLLRQPRALEREHIHLILQNAVRDEYDKPAAEYERGIAEGERRATARIVAAVRSLARYRWALGSDTLAGLSELLDAIERGEHAKEDVNYLECPWCGDPVKSLPSNEDGEWEDGTLGTCECGRRLRVWADETAHLLDLDEEGA